MPSYKVSIYGGIHVCKKGISKYIVYQGVSHYGRSGTKCHFHKDWWSIYFQNWWVWVTKLYEWSSKWSSQKQEVAQQSHNILYRWRRQKSPLVMYKCMDFFKNNNFTPNSEYLIRNCHTPSQPKMYTSHTITIITLIFYLIIWSLLSIAVY